MTRNTISIITLNWNRSEDTLECVQSILDQGLEEFKLFVIDNHSENSDYQRLQAAKAGFELLRLKENLGFAKGFNLGIKLALAENPDYLMIVNNDTVFLPNAIGNMLDVLQNSSYSVAAPLIYYHSDPNRVWSSGGSLFPFLAITLDAHHRTARLKGPTERNFLSGCCLLFSRKALEDIGFFDERFFMYYEDLDLCMRLQSRGIKSVVVPSAKLLHKVSLSSGGPGSDREQYLMAFSSVLYFHKYLRWYNAAIILSLRIVNLISKTARFLLQGQWSSITSMWSGVFDGLRAVAKLID